MGQAGPDLTEDQGTERGGVGIDGFLRELAALAARELGRGLSCGITLQPNGRPLTAANPASRHPARPATVRDHQIRPGASRSAGLAEPQSRRVRGR